MVLNQQDVQWIVPGKRQIKNHRWTIDCNGNFRVREWFVCQRKGKRRTDTQQATEGQDTALGFDQVLADRQAEPAPCKALIGRSFELRKRLEQAVLPLRGNAYAGIAYRKVESGLRGIVAESDGERHFS